MSAFSRSFAAALLLLVASLLVGSPLRAAEPCPDVSGVEFSQIDWFGTQAPPINDSEWGKFSAVIAPTAVVRYVNVVANAGGADSWIVRNLPTLPASREVASQRIATGFDLRPLGIDRGTDITQLRYAMSIDSAPRTTAPPVTPTTLAPVGSSRRDAEGVAGGPLTEPGAPATLPDTEPVLTPVGDAWHQGVPNIDLDEAADVNGCGPAAFANSIKWLGVTETPLQEVFDALGTAMGRNPGGTVSLAEALNGKLALNHSLGLGLTTKFQSDDLGAADYTYPGHPEYGSALTKGTIPTFDFIKSELDAGEDVELGMRFYRCGATDQGDECEVDADCNPGETCQPVGGHIVTVFSARDDGGKQFLFTVDDGEPDRRGGTERNRCELRKRSDGFFELVSAVFARNKVVFAVSESRPAPPPGEQCANWFDDDGNGLVDCADPACIAVCSSIGKDPGRIRFATGEFAGDAHDQLVVHGRVVPMTPIDPPNEQVGVILTNAAGVLYRAAVPPGALVARGNRGQRFVYRDTDAVRTRCGIAKIEMRYVPAHGYYRVRVVAYGDLSAATDPAMTLQFKVGDDGFVNSGLWQPTASGWKLVLPGE